MLSYPCKYFRTYFRTIVKSKHIISVTRPF